MKYQLVFSNYTITNSNIYGGVDYLQEINSGECLSIGVASSAEVTFTTDISTIAKGDVFTFKVNQNNDGGAYRTIGLFNVDTVTKSGTKYIIKAYDNMIKYDVIIDSWLDGLTFPMTLSTFLYSLSQYCGVLNSSSFTNNDYVVHDNFTSVNITGRQILRYIAEVAGSFAYMDNGGHLILKSYTSTSVNLTNSSYRKLTNDIGDVNAIDCVWCGQTRNDVGVQYPVAGGNNILRIENNPLLYCTASEESTVRTALSNILSNIDFSYTPMTIEMFEDFGIVVGTKIKVNNITTIVMSKTISKSGVILSSVGLKDRNDAVTYASSEVNGLRGQYNILNRDLEATEVIVGNHATQLSQTVRIAADGVTIKNAQGSTLVINGGCVDAETINANDLVLTGVIAWGDLNSDVQQRIESGELPDYIHSTYIDSTEIRSPEITGNNITAVGNFQVKQTLSGNVKGYMGYATGSVVQESGTAVTEGVALSISGNTITSASTEPYVIVTTSGARMSYGNNGILVTGTNAYYKNGNTSGWIPIGTATFG